MIFLTQQHVRSLYSFLISVSIYLSSIYLSVYLSISIWWCLCHQQILLDDFYYLSDQYWKCEKNIEIINCPGDWFLRTPAVNPLQPNLPFLTHTTHVSCHEPRVFCTSVITLVLYLCYLMFSALDSTSALVTRLKLLLQLNVLEIWMWSLTPQWMTDLTRLLTSKFPFSYGWINTFLRRLM